MAKRELKSKTPERPLGPPKTALRPVERRVTRTLGDRLKRIKERSDESVRDDRMAVYIMILAVILIVGTIITVSLKLHAHFGLGIELDPLVDLQVETFINGEVTRLDDGRIEIFYDFEPLDYPEGVTEEEKKYYDRYPQLDDWSYEKGIDAFTGRLINGATSFITFEGPVTVECGFEILRGASAAVVLNYQIDGSYFQLQVTRNGLAAVSRYKAGAYQPLSDNTEVNVGPRTVHTMKLEVTKTEVLSYIDGELVHSVSNPYPDHSWGVVKLKAFEAYVAFDDVKITGRPSKEWIDAKLKIQKTLAGGKKPSSELPVLPPAVGAPQKALPAAPAEAAETTPPDATAPVPVAPAPE